MRWQAKHTRLEIPNGSTRLKRIFAWWPTYISGQIAWLETYEILQVYIIIEQKVIIEEKETIFAICKWTNLSKRLCK